MESPTFFVLSASSIFGEVVAGIEQLEIDRDYGVGEDVHRQARGGKWGRAAARSRLRNLPGV